MADLFEAFQATKSWADGQVGGSDHPGELHGPWFLTAKKTHKNMIASESLPKKALFLRGVMAYLEDGLLILSQKLR